MEAIKVREGAIGGPARYDADPGEWVQICRKLQQRKIMIFAFGNNHYGGHAPATVELFLKLWSE